MTPTENKAKHPGGRPPIFETPEQMQEAVDRYFEREGGKGICDLACFLGFKSRQSFLDYAAKDEFSDIIKQARLRIEAYYETQGNGKTAKDIFALKQLGWKDEQQVQHGVTDELADLLREINGSRIIPS